MGETECSTVSHHNSTFLSFLSFGLCHDFSLGLLVFSMYHLKNFSIY